MNDELRRAISVAQTAHDRNDGPADNTAVAIGALIRAVTILAGEQPTSREESIRMCNETRDAAVLAFGEAADTEIKKVKSEIESLKNRLAEQGARESRLHVVLSDHGLPTEPKALARELTQRSAPMTVDGKTLSNEEVERIAVVVGENGGESLSSGQMERIAKAVLCAFGQSSQTTQTNATDVLSKLASYWEKGAAHKGMPEQYRRGLKDCAKELREEFANLSAEPPSDATTPKFFANENEIRGTYFCTAITLRPYLHVGHDAEFDDIPRILKLGRNDVIEVRVVERAER